jgi:hypothetical protein
MQVNTTNVVDRHNRPTVLQKVALRTFFINDGEYYDPYDISGVTVFTKYANTSPSSILSNNLVASSVPESTILMHFTASANDAGAALDPTSYNPATDPACLSGIYRMAQGEYVCILDGTQDISGVYNLHGSSLTVANGASAVNDYIDAWTIKFAAGSDYQTLINDFHLYDDTFFSITQPLILTAQNRLINKHLTLNSIENLKLTTEITIGNKDIDESIKNIFKDSMITSPQIKIEKVNEDTVSLPATVTVSGYSDTASLIDVTSDNTVLFRFDTTTLATHGSVADFGGLTGTYRLVLKYNLLNETIITPPYYFTIS